MVFFLRPGTSEGLAQLFAQKLQAQPGVLRVAMTTADDAFDEYRHLFADKPELAAGIDAGSIPPTVRLVAADEATVGDLRARFENALEVLRVSIENPARLLDFVASPNPVSMVPLAGWPSESMLNALEGAAPSEIEHDIASVATAIAAMRDNVLAKRSEDAERLALAIRDHARQTCRLELG